MRYLFIFLLLSAPGFADDTGPVPIPAKPVLVFPSFPQPTPAPRPDVPKPAADSVPVLKPNTWYIVTSEVDFFLLASPADKVTITVEPGPLRIKGVFADGDGKPVVRNYTAKWIATVEAVEGATGRVELIGFPKGVADATDVTRQLVDIGVAPIPPPTSTISGRVTKALVGDTARSDAIALAGSCSAIISKIDSLPTTGSVQETFVAMLTVNKWTKGKYTDIQNLLNEEFPPGDSKDLDVTERVRLKNLFSQIEAGAKEAVK